MIMLNVELFNQKEHKGITQSALSFSQQHLRVFQCAAFVVMILNYFISGRTYTGGNKKKVAGKGNL